MSTLTKLDDDDRPEFSGGRLNALTVALCAMTAGLSGSQAPAGKRLNAES